MTRQLALDEKTNDLIRVEGKGFARVSDGRYVVQLAKNKLLTSLGEWKLDKSIGWLQREDYERNPDLFDIEMRAVKVLLSVPGLQSVDDIKLKLESRVLIITFNATTIYGGIDLTIPWSL